MSSHRRLACPVLVTALAFVCLALPDALASTPPPERLDCGGAMAADCQAVLPGAVRFVTDEGASWATGQGAEGEAVGWVVLSTDVVDIDAYSGKPLVTLVALGPDGRIRGARILHHSEPILLVGIPEQALTDFVDFYRGKLATTKVVVGSSPAPEAVTVDAISGATVTALAQNQTILESARRLGVAVGVIPAEEIHGGRFVQGERPWSWAEMVEGGVFGRLTVRPEDMGQPAGGEVFLDAWFTLVEAPHIGRALFGDREYAYQMSRLGPGEHLLLVVGNGTSSFKGSGFVRGGIFDRVRLEQGLRSAIFRDHDYEPVSRLVAAGAPAFKEGGLFITRDGVLDPGAEWNFVFIGSRYDMKGGFTRDFQSFQTTHRLPPSVYEVDGGGARDLGAEIVAQAWYNQRWNVLLLGFALLSMTGFFVARRWLTSDATRLRRMHFIGLLLSFVVLGLVLRAQPSVTQLLTLVGSLVGELKMDLFLSEPLLFVFWSFIAVVTLIWGRGVFCGWMCPYGAFNELLFKLGRLLRLPEFELPDRAHRVTRYARYGILVALIAVFLYSPEDGERLAEVEPFKTTFFVAPWTREWLFVGWWVLLAAASLFWWRPFCRYVCPLGAALAIPGSVRLSGPHRRRFCSSCTLCTKICEPRAIREDGSIDPRECLSCMECEANFRSPEICPPLIGLDRLRLSASRDGKEPDPQRVARLERDAEQVRRPRKEARA